MKPRPGQTSKPPTRRITWRVRVVSRLWASKPPTRRITKKIRFASGYAPSKPPTRRITPAHGAGRSTMPSKPPTRRITRLPPDWRSSASSKPPTRRITNAAQARGASQTSKPPTRRITRISRKVFPAFQQVTLNKASETSFLPSLSNYLILNSFSRQLFYEAKGRPSLLSGFLFLEENMQRPIPPPSPIHTK